MMYHRERLNDAPSCRPFLPAVSAPPAPLACHSCRLFLPTPTSRCTCTSLHPCYATPAPVLALLLALPASFSVDVAPSPPPSAFQRSIRFPTRPPPPPHGGFSPSLPPAPAVSIPSCRFPSLMPNLIPSKLHCPPLPPSLCNSSLSCIWCPGCSPRILQDQFRRVGLKIFKH